MPLPGGDLACVWFGGMQERMADISVYFSRLAKGSEAWSEAVKLPDDPARSEQDDGVTWGAIEMLFDLEEGHGVFGRHPPVVLDSGRWVLLPWLAGPQMGRRRRRELREALRRRGPDVARRARAEQRRRSEAGLLGYRFIRSETVRARELLKSVDFEPA